MLFVPSAFTPVCSSEIRGHARASLAGARLLVVSCDTAHTLEHWLRVEGISTGEDIVVGSDFWPHGEVARAFRAFDPNTGWPRRVSVLIDEVGLVRWATTSPAGIARSAGEAEAAIAEIGDGAGSVSV